MSVTPHSGRPCCASGAIWRGFPIINCLRGTWLDYHCWTLLSTTSPSGGSNPAKKARVDDMEWFFSITTPDHTHCKHNESGHSGTRLGLEILPHSPYSPDLAPSDYHIFRSLSSNLRGVSFNDTELQNWLDEFFTAKPGYFFKFGI
jgi:hypothetical protein